MTTNFSTKDKFDAAVRVIQGLPKNGTFQPSQELMLRFYSLFKHARFGACRDPKPAFWDVVGKAKWTAWSALSNLSQEEAMQLYVDELKNVIETMPHTPQVSQFIETLGNFYESVEDTGTPSTTGLLPSSSSPIAAIVTNYQDLATATLVSPSKLSSTPTTIVPNDGPMLLTDSQLHQCVSTSLPPDILRRGDTKSSQPIQEQLCYQSSPRITRCSTPCDESEAAYLSSSCSDDELFCDSLDCQPISDDQQTTPLLQQVQHHRQPSPSNLQILEAVSRLQSEVSSLTGRLSIIEDLMRPDASHNSSNSVQSYVSRLFVSFKRVLPRSRTMWWITVSPLVVLLIHMFISHRRLRQRRLL